ncbi:MAG: hypothetical protein AB1696_28930 [Planctomycetota bacterium]
MSGLPKFFRRVMRGVRPHPPLGAESGPCWKLPHVERDLPAFVRALPRLLPEGGVFYMEGPAGQTPPEVREFLEAHDVPDEVKLVRAILWPRPDIFHVPIDEKIMSELADLLSHYETPAGTLQLQAYRDKQALLWAVSAFYDQPVIISKKVAEDNVRAFCSALGCSYVEG